MVTLSDSRLRTEALAHRLPPSLLHRSLRYQNHRKVSSVLYTWPWDPSTSSIDKTPTTSKTSQAAQQALTISPGKSMVSQTFKPTTRSSSAHCSHTQAEAFPASSTHRRTTVHSTQPFVQPSPHWSMDTSQVSLSNRFHAGHTLWSLLLPSTSSVFPFPLSSHGQI